MATPATDVASLRISTDALPERDRLPYWREEVGRRLFHAEISSVGEGPFYTRAVFNSLPGARIATFTTSAVRYERTSSNVAQDGGDHIGVSVNLGGAALISQRGCEVALVRGDAVVASHSEPTAFTPSEGSYIGLFLPAAALKPLIGQVEQAPRLIPRSSTALRLLVGYLGAIREEFTIGEPELGLRTVTHINDLVAMAIGATRDGAALAVARGVRAARLRAVKADIVANLASRDLSVTAVALRQRVTPRYIHMLFEGEGTTFSEFVMGERLACAHRMLVDIREDHRTITAIAYASGFGDLSYFNRSFRRRYGVTPSDVRRRVG